MMSRARLLNSLCALSVCGCSLLATLARAADPAAEQKVFTQVPEIASGNEAAAAPAPPSKPAAKTDWNAGPTPQWIWGAHTNSDYFLRKTFTGGSKSARLIASCDNEMKVFLNGQQIAASGEWQSPPEVDVQKLLREGENVLTAQAVNHGAAAGFVLKLALTGADGQTRYVVSDESWQASAAADGKDAVAVSVKAKYGAAPWGKVFDADSRAAGSVARGTFNVLPGFQVERLFTVPKDELGSWVNITSDNRGRLIVSDQGGKGLCRVTPPAIGGKEPTKVERLDVKISGAQGLLWAFDSLYVMVNAGGEGPGLYRVKDTNGDGELDAVEKLREIHGSGEHGPHALRLSPDGKSIYALAGNHTRPPFERELNAKPQTMGGIRAEQLHAQLPEGAASRLPANWDEDLVLPRQWDGNGHAAGILAPGGWIAKTDPEGKTWEVVSSGYRNEFDMAFNADGELFAYDADMEWDYGMPWYRPTRVCHAASGSEFGWRSGTGKWPTYYPDSLPEVVNIGPGSPVGVEFGYGTKFPAKYQKALYLCDWTFGTMYAIHLEPSGASYKGLKEEFVSRSPLPLTDATVGRDGALYFTIGGRGAQSELFRVTYVGKESTAPAELHDARQADLRELRHRIEAYHAPGKEATSAVAFLLPYLGHADRHIRYAARVGLEHIPVEHWLDKSLAAGQPQAVITAVVGLARQAEPAVRPKLLAALGKIDPSKLSEAQQLELLRAYQLTLIRLGLPNEAEQKPLAARFESLFPAKSDFVNRELANLMVALNSPHVIAKLLPTLKRERVITSQDYGDLLSRNAGYGGTVATVEANQPDQQQMAYVFALRNVKSGWTTGEREVYFTWFEKARTWSGGASYQKFLTHIEDDAFANASDAERLLIESRGWRKPYKIPPLPKPVGPGKTYTVDDVLALAQDALHKRNFKNGQKMFAAARCVICHRFNSEGGATGPDLTQLAGRFTLKDLAESIIEPSKVVSDQYKSTIVQTADGKVYTGRIVSMDDNSITVLTDPEDSTKIVVIKKTDIEEQKPSPVSLMPKDLLGQLNEKEVLDLLAYLLSRGSPQDAMFK